MLNPLRNQIAHTTFRAPYVKSRKKERIKIDCSSMPEKEEKQKTSRHTGFDGYSEWTGEEQTSRRTDRQSASDYRVFYSDRLVLMM